VPVPFLEKIVSPQTKEAFLNMCHCERRNIIPKKEILSDLKKNADDKTFTLILLEHTKYFLILGKLATFLSFHAFSNI